MNQNVCCASGNPLELANLAQHNLMLSIASLKVADALNTEVLGEEVTGNISGKYLAKGV